MSHGLCNSCCGDIDRQTMSIAPLDKNDLDDFARKKERKNDERVNPRGKKDASYFFLPVFFLKRASFFFFAATSLGLSIFPSF
jgi:hypothetical protein